MSRRTQSGAITAYFRFLFDRGQPRKRVLAKDGGGSEYGRHARAFLPAWPPPAFFLHKRVIFRNTPAPARPSRQHTVVFASPEDFFQEDEKSIFNTIFALKSADFFL